MFRFIYFYIVLHRYFLMENGIKVFGEQSLNFILRYHKRKLLPILKKIGELRETSKSLHTRMEKILAKGTLTIEDAEANRNRGFSFTLLYWLLVLLESAVNYTGAYSVFGEGLDLWRCALALGITLLSVALLRYWLEYGILDVPWGERKAIRWKEVILAWFLGISVEVGLFFFATVRFFDSESGGSLNAERNTALMYFLVILGMILPIGAAIVAHTIRDARVINRITDRMNTINGRLPQLQQEYLHALNAYISSEYAFLRELQVYVTTWRSKRKLPIESLQGHCTHNFESFRMEAVKNCNAMGWADLHPPLFTNTPSSYKMIVPGGNGVFSSLLIPVALCLLLASCSHYRNHTIVIQDFSLTRTEKSIFENARLVSERVFLRQGPDDLFSAIPADGASLSSSRRLFYEDLSSITWSRKTDVFVSKEDSFRARRERHLTSRAGELLAALQDPDRRRQFGKKSDILRAIEYAAQLLVPAPQSDKGASVLHFFSGKPAFATENIIILCTDGLNEDPSDSFYDFSGWQNLSPPEVEKRIDTLLAQGRIPDLHGARVFMHGIEAVDNRLFANVKLFWQLYFLEANAELVAYGSRIEVEIAGAFDPI